jgi:hypothetical protein
MDSLLFHKDTSSIIDLVELRRYAANCVSRAPLIRQAAAGDRNAAIALHIGYWPFVREFEHAIDRRGLPRGPLVDKFGASASRRKIVALAGAVREMKEEEGSHAAHWAKDAQRLGVSRLESEPLPEVQALIDGANGGNLVEFFCRLAGTEFIAEELSRALERSAAYTGLFSNSRWIWGEIHLAPHDEDGASHLEIDVDLARAYSQEAPAAAAITIDREIRQTADAFVRAADAVYNKLVDRLRDAA